MELTTVSSLINILVVDDQKTIRQFLKSSLEFETDFNIVGMANNGQEAIEKVAELQPNIVIMDIDMPVMNGLAATKIIAERYTSTKVLMFSLYDDDESLSGAIEAGAKGYLFKNTPPEEIVTAIRFVDRGYFQLGPGLLERYLYRFSVNASANKNIHQKLTELYNVYDKNDKNIDINFVANRMVRDVSKIEKNLMLNRTLIYTMFVFNALSLFLVILART